MMTAITSNTPKAALILRAADEMRDRRRGELDGGHGELQRDGAGAAADPAPGGVPEPHGGHEHDALRLRAQPGGGDGGGGERPDLYGIRAARAGDRDGRSAPGGGAFCPTRNDSVGRAGRGWGPARAGSISLQAPGGGGPGRGEP